MHFKKPLLLVILFCLALVDQASANGRYPRAVRLLQSPTTPERLVLAGTFGLAVSDDGGQNWTYVCEAAFSDPDAILDPLIGYTKDGTLYTGTALDLRRSDDEVCEFDVVLGEPGQFVPDYTFDVDGQSIVSVVASIVDGKDQVTLQVSPDGTNWEAMGPAIQERSVLTLDVAPSDDQRVYISALAPELDEEGAVLGQRGVLLVSSDRGQSWSELEIPDTSFDAQPFIARIHPSDPDVLYVRVDGRKLDEFDLPVADDVLLVSKDAGQSWEELIRKSSKLLAFELSPDGATILAGFGVSDDSDVGVTRSEHGLYRITQSATAEVQVERLLDGISTHCLTWTENGLYVCLRQFSNPANFEVGFTSNHDFTELAELTSLLQLNKLGAPRACPGGAEASVCPARWETDCVALLSCSSAPATTDGSAGAASDGATEGGGGAPADSSTNSSMGGTAGSTVASSGGGTAGTGGTSPKASKDSPGCGCRLDRAGSNTGRSTSLALLLVGCLSFARRRRDFRKRRGTR